MRGKLRVSENLYNKRRDRMKKILDLDAPQYLVWFMGKKLMRSFERQSLREWFQEYKLNHCPHWLLLLVDKQYRQIDQEEREREKPCVSCGLATDQICENCEAPLCYGCDSMKYHDILTCKDEVSCSLRCKDNESSMG